MERRRASPRRPPWSAMLMSGRPILRYELDAKLKPGFGVVTCKIVLLGGCIKQAALTFLSGYMGTCRISSYSSYQKDSGVRVIT